MVGRQAGKGVWLLEKRMREAGAEGMAFPVIAAFGENSARPHAVCGERRLADGQPEKLLPLVNLSIL